MLKTIRTAIALITITGSMMSCRDSNDPVAVLKHRIDNAKMMEYVDSLHGAKVLYPDFFHIDSIGEHEASFSYSDKDVKVLILSYHTWPPRIFDTSHEAVRLFSDSLNVCLEEKTSSFTMTGEQEKNSPITYLEKANSTSHGWALYTLTYEKKYEDAVERLTEMIKDWKIYNDKHPKWIQDIFYFLDI